MPAAKIFREIAICGNSWTQRKLTRRFWPPMDAQEVRPPTTSTQRRMTEDSEPLEKIRYSGRKWRGRSCEWRSDVDAEELVRRRELLFGAGDRGRTGDIFLGKEALYH
jgi:hypothetical protein